MEFPTNEFCEIERNLLLIFNWCKTDDAIRAYEAAVKRTRELRATLKKEREKRAEK